MDVTFTFNSPSALDSYITSLTTQWIKLLMWTQSCYTQKNSFSSVWAEDTASFHVQIKLSLITEPSMRFRAEKKKKKKKNNRVRPCWSFSVLFSRQKYAASWEQMNRRCVSLQHTCNMYTFVFLFVLYVFILAFFSCACMHFWSV